MVVLIMSTYKIHKFKILKINLPYICILFMYLYMFYFYIIFVISCGPLK